LNSDSGEPKIRGDTTMKKLLVAALIAIITTFGLSQSGSAKAKYSIQKQSFWQKTTINRAKYPKKSIAVWNAKHTKVKFYLKDYPNNSWYGRGSEILKHGKTTAKYTYITGHNKKHTDLVSGYVWHGNLELGFGKKELQSNYLRLDFFVNNGDYLSYLKKSPSQKITREIIKLFPNNKVTLKMTDIAAITNASYFPDIAPSPYSVKPDLTKYTIVKFPKVITYLNASKNTPVKTRVQKVKAILASYGYTTNKLNHLSKNYRIGLNIVDSTYRTTYSDSHMDSGYAFIIGKHN